MTPRWLPILTVVLALGLVASLVGWFFSGRDGAGTPIDCYSIEGDVLSFSPVHGTATTKATFSVAESVDEVVVGYWEDRESGDHTMQAFSIDVSYLLTQRLGNRPVVDPAGKPIKKC
jgi:hypothetical protein